MYRHIKEEELKLDKTLGYLYFLDKEHPFASIGVGKVYYHRHIASIAIGRWLTSDEVVHHVDSNKLNNSIDNLKILTASEHAKEHTSQDAKCMMSCVVCGNPFEIYKSQSSKRKVCSTKCIKEYRSKWFISKEELEILIWNYPYTHVGKMFGVSDNGVRKKAKSLKCKLPPAYFFNKSEEFRKIQRGLEGMRDLSPH